MEIIINLELISYIFFGLLVALYSGWVFNKPLYKYCQYSERDAEDADGYSTHADPSVPKYMTETSRYHFYLVLFSIISVVLYSLLGALLNQDLVGLLGLKAHPAGKFFLAAIIIIGVTSMDVKNLGWVRFLLIDSIRAWLHGYANIPNRGRDLFNVLSDAEIDYQSEVGKRFIDEVTTKSITYDAKNREDLDLYDFTVGNRDTISWKWARLSYCLHFIEEGIRQDIFTGVIHESSLGWISISREYQKAVSSVTKNKKNQLNEDEQIILNDQLKRLLAKTYRLISCLLLMVRGPEENSVKRLNSVGFNVVLEHRYFIPSKEIIRVVSSVFGGIITFSIVASLIVSGIGAGINIINIKDILVFMASAFAILIMPVIIVMIMKKILCPSGSWGIAKLGEDYDRPVLNYIFTAALSWLVTFSMMVLLGLFLIAQNNEYIEPDSLFSDMAVYSLLSALTALFVAYRIDIPSREFKSRISHIFWKIRGGVIQGVATAVLTWICLMITMYGGDFLPAENISENEMGRLVIYEILAFSSGFIFSVSLFFRKHFFERRRNNRCPISRKVQANIDGVRQTVTLIDITKSGVAFVMEKANTLKTGTLVELFFDNDEERSGTVISESNGIMHLAFIH